ncbi:LCP family protein [Streptomyces sp. MST-110588]|uniref:LCP family protein n=1 Tax=Streptomyces sp. MST-110588 TaxID=2833628 RepID=UPI001F5E325A|nr:LCP family protein [Streptomyces sp. MST-110588]UNO43995.1 LCP family protein [Streptomyces sp. MST-110588]
MTRRGRILAWTGGVIGVLLLVTAGVGAWVYQHLDSNIHGADVGSRLGGDRPANLSPGSKNILVVGSDSRAGANAKYGKNLETMQSDTLMVLHIAANREWATAVSFPRDSWVPIPACDKGKGVMSKPHHFKINEAFSIGGESGDIANAAACTIKTVEKNTGLRIDHFVSVDFQGFKGMVNALGGIEVCPKHAIHDKKAHLDMDAGCQNVTDEKALGYVRTRYSVGDGSDLGRIGRQQEFMKALGEKAQSKLSSPTALYGFLDSATKSLTTDKDLAGVKPLSELASTVKDIPSNRLTFLTVPNYSREADVPTDKANVIWQYPQAGQLFSDLAHDREVDKKKLAEASKNPITARSVKVRVLNGTGRTGVGAKAAEQVRRLGFTVVATGNAPANVTRTEVGAPAALKAQAEVLASRFPGTKATGTAGAAGAAPGVVTLTVGPDFPLPN